MATTDFKSSAYGGRKSDIMRVDKEKAAKGSESTKSLTQNIRKLISNSKHTKDSVGRQVISK